MAQLACSSDDGREAVFTGTFLKTGDVVTLCDECLAMWCAATLEVMTGVDPEPFIRAISDEGEESSYAQAAEAGEPIEPGVSHGAPSVEAPDPAPADTDPDAQLNGGGPHRGHGHSSASSSEQAADPAVGVGEAADADTGGAGSD